MKEDVMPKDFTSAVKDIKLAILQARARAAQLSNIEALKLYFFVGGYISKKTRSAKWGTGAIDALSKRLQVELPGLRGFSTGNIRKMRLFFEAWASYFSIRSSPTNELEMVPIRHLASGENRSLVTNDFRQMPLADFEGDVFSAFMTVGFTHHVSIFMATKDVDERLYYVMACAKGHWNVQQLESHLRADDYHHIGALPNNFEKTLSPMSLATQAVRSFRDEYLLDLVNLDNVDATKDEDIDERVLSKALVIDVEKTIQALGGDDFCFIGREKRLVYSNEEFFIDLLFFHRGLQALIAVELKMGKFRPSYLGQLEFYLSALDELIRKPNENPSIGLILCEKMNKGVVEFAIRDKSKPLGIATYQTLHDIPKPYQTLAPVIEGVRRVLAENTSSEQQVLKSTKKYKESQ
ncbi:MAG: PDDEXK nuclease domain-containing protein [Lentisphaeria bacterium]|nr:PDDEXK nuclease domain-containing protein [Lentisphaeria bacterium]